MKYFISYALLLITICGTAQVKIGDNPNAIDAASVLEIEDTTRGVLITRMSTTQRDAISSPPDGLQIYNVTTSTIDVYRSNQWGSTKYTNPIEKTIYVFSLEDLPDPSGNSITLDPNSMYIFKGIVNISPYYLELNGASLRGLDPAHDGLSSTVSGGILRSTDVSVYMDGLVVVPLSASTKAYDLSDATGTKFCNLFSANSVIEVGIPSLGVGQISGFEAITIKSNYWSCTDGLKVTGTIGKFSSAYTFITNITSGSGIEFLSGIVVDDIDLSNNYFNYSGQTGVKVNPGATIDRGRMTTNMFRDVSTPLDGFDSYSLGWSMSQNTNIPDSRSFCYLYFNNNNTSTSLPNQYPSFYKISGATTTIDQKRFTSTDNKMTYIGLEPLSAKISVVIGAKAPSNNSDFSVVISKNGSPISAPVSSMAPATNNQSFQIILNSEENLVTGDYLEVYICRNNNNNSSIKVEELQFRVMD